MTGIFWGQIVAAVLCGNVLSLWWGYSLWRINKNEQAGIEPHKGPMIYLIGAAVPPLAGASALYFIN